MRKLMVEVHDTDIIEHVSNLPEHDIVNIIQQIDTQAQSWELTKELFYHFAKEMRSYFKNNQEFLDFIEKTKEL